MIYPIVIVVAMIGVSLFVSIKLIPALEGMFEEAGARLPWMTRLVMAFSHFLIHSWLWLIIGIVAVATFLVYFYRTPTGETIAHHLLLKDPTGLFKNIYMLRFTRTLGSLLASGVSIIDAIDITSEVMGNDVYREELRYFSKELEKGVPLSVPLSKSHLFPYLFLKW